MMRSPVTTIPVSSRRSGSWQVRICSGCFANMAGFD